MIAPVPVKGTAPRSGPRSHSLLHAAMMPQEDDQDLWLISYADMMTLLFAVFVVVVSIVGLAPQAAPSAAPIVTPAPSTWELLLAAHGNDGGGDIADVSPGVTLAPGQVIVDGADAVRIRWLDYLRRLGLDKTVEINVVDSRIALVVRDQVMFTSAHAALDRDGASVLQRLAALLSGVPGALTIEGHTDNLPVHGGAFSSNWDLSGARAAAVAQGLVDFGLPANRLRIVGYGDTRPVADNTTPEGRAANRRVVFVVEP